MKISSDKIERLIFVKYLLSQAKEQVKLERPLCSSAILTLHDCIECFLQLCFEIKTLKSKTNSTNILDTYAEEINKILKEENQSIISKAFLKRINDLRNNLKHSTIFTDHKQIPNLYIETEIFLNDFTPIIFDVSFDRISLVDLISDENVKKHLVSADELIKNQDYQKAMWAIGMAFYEIKSKALTVEGKYGNEYLNNLRMVSYLPKYEACYGGEKPDKVLSENLIEIANDINNLQKQINETNTILSLNVDKKDFYLFVNNMPVVEKISSSEGVRFWIPDEERKNEVNYKIETVMFCYEFVTELALK